MSRKIRVRIGGVKETALGVFVKGGCGERSLLIGRSKKRDEMFARARAGSDAAQRLLDLPLGEEGETVRSRLRQRFGGYRFINIYMLFCGSLFRCRYFG